MLPHSQLAFVQCCLTTYVQYVSYLLYCSCMPLSQSRGQTLLLSSLSADSLHVAVMQCRSDQRAFKDFAKTSWEIEFECPFNRPRLTDTNRFTRRSAAPDPTEELSGPTKRVSHMSQAKLGAEKSVTALCRWYLLFPKILALDLTSIKSVARQKVESLSLSRSFHLARAKAQSW